MYMYARDDCSRHEVLPTMIAGIESQGNKDSGHDIMKKPAYLFNAGFHQKNIDRMIAGSY